MESVTLDFSGVFYGFEETSSEGRRENFYGLSIGQKCIITVSPTYFELRNIDERWEDRKGDQGLGHEFRPNQISIEQRVIEEGFFIFKRKSYILSVTITYQTEKKWSKYTHSFKVDERSRNNILSIVGK